MYRRYFLRTRPASLAGYQNYFKKRHIKDIYVCIYIYMYIYVYIGKYSVMHSSRRKNHVYIYIKTRVCVVLPFRRHGKPDQSISPREFPRGNVAYLRKNAGHIGALKLPATVRYGLPRRGLPRDLSRVVRRHGERVINLAPGESRAPANQTSNLSDPAAIGQCPVLF